MGSPPEASDPGSRGGGGSHPTPSSSPTAGSPVPSDAAQGRLVLSDLLNRVLDRGLLITGTVTLAVADVDLVQLDLNLVLTAVETAVRHTAERDRP